jgi:heme/copper-type cytochrome/quinol oxidase subunit 2
MEVDMSDILFYTLLQHVNIFWDGTEATTEAVTDVTTEGKNLMDILDVTEETAQLSSILMDIIYIMVVVVIAMALITLLLYFVKFLKNRKDPNYKKNDDDFLDY